MPGLFDRLQTQINDKSREGGITALDLADLPPALRKIMRLMLRQLQMNYPQLCEAMDGMPETDRLSRADLERSLETLTQQAWLTRLGEGEKAVYKVNLKAKSGSTLASGIWSALDDKLKK
jgi:hypothetical protein